MKIKLEFSKKTYRDCGNGNWYRSDVGVWGSNSGEVVMLAPRQTAVTRQLTSRNKSAMRDFPRRFPRVSSSDL